MPKINTGLTLEQLKALPEQEQERIYKKIKDLRKPYKVVNYSSLYGVGATKLARETGVTVKEAEGLLAAFWDRNKAILTVSNKVRTKTLKDGSMWLYNPVSKFWYSLRKERDKFSTINQSTGVFVFDTWLYFCSQKGRWPVLQMHDESLFVVTKGDEGHMIEVLDKSMEETNVKLGLNVEIKHDYNTGKSYAEVH